MTKRPTYIREFSRDFTLALIETWWRAETPDRKCWTNKRLPFYPYLVFERSHGIVNSYYDSRGVAWIKNELITNIKESDTFLENLAERYIVGIKKIASYKNPANLSISSFKHFFSDLEKAWAWFDAAWWVWEITPAESKKLLIPEDFNDLRRKTQNFVEDTDKTIRLFLKHLYPNITSYHDVLLVEEVLQSDIPGQRELVERKNSYFFTDNDLFIKLSRKDIEKKFAMIFEDHNVKNSLGSVKGLIACQGKVCGHVKIVSNVTDLAKVCNGDILVSPMTLPSFLPAIKKSSAIVTDEGGFLSHAAIISRELKKPCIIGTKIATKVLKDNDMIEVDANKGTVRRLNV
jgi:phosphohistidine swiveling domain-containing protein